MAVSAATNVEVQRMVDGLLQGGAQFIEVIARPDSGMVWVHSWSNAGAHDRSEHADFVGAICDGVVVYDMAAAGFDRIVVREPIN